VARFDLSLDELRGYRPAVAEPADFDDFWATTIAAARAVPTAPVVRPVDGPITQFDVFDVTFAGYGGEPVAGWLIAPRDPAGELPVVVEFVGYGGGRGLAHERLAWPAAGYAYFLMDTRGQGSSWGTGGVTPDASGSGPAVPGFLTRGIDNPRTYYYRRVFTDAVRAVDAVRRFPQIDADRLAVTGLSQGGGIALAVAGLVDGLVAVMPDVPFLCHFERAVGMTDADPYAEVVRYLSVHRDRVPDVFRTLSYFDGVNFAKRATAPSLFSVALLDLITPPSTVFAAHNAYLGATAIEVYPFNQHEGGQGAHWLEQARWLAALLG